MAVFRTNVCETHVLPSWPKMAVHENQAGTLAQRNLERALEVLSRKTRIPVNSAISKLRKNKTANERGVSCLSDARIPETEAKIFLMVRSDQMQHRIAVYWLRHRSGIGSHGGSVSKR
jgi:hypothetical protein